MKNPIKNKILSTTVNERTPLMKNTLSEFIFAMHAAYFIWGYIASVNHSSLNFRFELFESSPMSNKSKNLRE